MDVAVAWDNLTASSSLAGHRATPRVPTMGQAGDYYLTYTGENGYLYYKEYKAGEKDSGY